MMHPEPRMGVDTNGGNGTDLHAAARQRARLMELLVAEQTGTATDAEQAELAAHAGAGVLEAERELALETALNAVAAVAAVGGGSLANANNGYGGGYGNRDGFAALPAGLRFKLVADAERCLGKPLPDRDFGSTYDGPSALTAAPIIHRGGSRLDRADGAAGRTPGWGRVAAPWLIAAAASIAAVFAWVKPPAPAESESARLVAKLAQASDRKLLAFAANVDDYKGVSGSVQWSPSMQAGTMTLKGLRPLAESEGVYQLWIVDGNRQGPPVDGGVFTVATGENGEAVVPFTARLPVGKAAAFAITREKAEGVVVSAGPLLLVAAAK